MLLFSWQLILDLYHLIKNPKLIQCDSIRIIVCADNIIGVLVFYRLQSLLRRKQPHCQDSLYWGRQGEAPPPQVFVGGKVVTQYASAHVSHMGGSMAP